MFPPNSLIPITDTTAINFCTTNIIKDAFYKLVWMEILWFGQFNSIHVFMHSFLYVSMFPTQVSLPHRHCSVLDTCVGLVTTGPKLYTLYTV